MGLRFRPVSSGCQASFSLCFPGPVVSDCPRSWAFLLRPHMSIKLSLNAVGPGVIVSFPFPRALQTFRLFMSGSPSSLLMATNFYLRLFVNRHNDVPHSGEALSKASVVGSALVFFLFSGASRVMHCSRLANPFVPPPVLSSGALRAAFPGQAPPVPADGLHQFFRFRSPTPTAFKWNLSPFV